MCAETLEQGTPTCPKIYYIPAFMRSSFAVLGVSLMLAGVRRRCERTRTAVTDSGGPRIVPGSVAGAVALQLWQLATA